MSDKPLPERRLLAANRRAQHEYHILERFEAGVVLTGTEVKSCRTGSIQLKEGFVDFRAGRSGQQEAWLVGVHISAYHHGPRDNPPPLRERKLLLGRREIDRLAGRVQVKGLTVVPLSAYLKGDHVKVEIGLVQGKKLHDKRETERKKELDREAARAMAGERD